MSMVYVAVIGGLVIGAGSTAYSLYTAPGAPSYQAPPPPPNYTQYDENGEIVSRQTAIFNTPGVPSSGIKEWVTYGPNSEPQKPATEWASKITGDYAKDMQDPTVKAEVEKRFAAHVAGDPKGVEEHSGGWRQEEYGNMFKEAPTALEQYNKESAGYQAKHDKWAADKAQREEDKTKLAGIRTQVLDNLNATPEDRKAAYEEYAKNFADAAHRDVDPRFAKIERSTDEQANATGMFGSRAYVDTKAELAKDKAAQDTDIATQAGMAKESLANNDRTYWMNMLNQIDSGQRADTLAQAQISKNTADIANQNYAGTLGYYQMQNANRAAECETKQRLSASYANAGTGLAGGLLYLYGNKSGAKAPTTV